MSGDRRASRASLGSSTSTPTRIATVTPASAIAVGLWPTPITAPIAARTQTTAAVRDDHASPEKAHARHDLTQDAGGVPGVTDAAAPNLHEDRGAEADQYAGAHPRGLAAELSLDADDPSAQDGRADCAPELDACGVEEVHVRSTLGLIAKIVTDGDEASVLDEVLRRVWRAPVPCGGAVGRDDAGER